MRIPSLLTVALAVTLGACSSTQSPTCTSGCPCQSQAACPSGQTCVAGFCAAAQACTTDADCTNPADICVAGSCVPGGTDGGSGDAGSGDAGAVDGGRDAGLPDAGPDAGPPDAGTADAGVDGGPDAGDAGPVADAGTPDAGCTQASDCAPLVCKDGTCQDCTANTDCVSPMVCCLSGSCTPGTCIPPGCMSDIQCNPPEEICVVGKCVSGCLLGSCDAGLRCDQLVTGRCEPASGNGNPGDPCQSFSDCSATPSNSNSGDCLSLALADGGLQVFCSLACQGTDQCPPGDVCDVLGAAGQCVPEAFVGGTQDYGAGAIGATCALGSAACDAVPACGTYGSGSGPVCSDTCLGPTSEVCPTTGWQCDDVLLFAGLVGAGTACSADSTCTSLSPDALCDTPARGGDGKCHFVYRQEDCFETPAGGGPTATSGAACSADSDCKFSFCNAGKCADPCCASSDCPSGFACAPVIAQQFSTVMACIPNSATGAVGAACDPTAATNACRALQSNQQGGGGLCLPTNAYDDTSTAGYCSDYCCTDSECGSGFTCGPVEVGTDNKGHVLYANACLEL